MTRRRTRPNIAELLRPLRPIVARIEAAQIRRFGRSGLGVLFRTDVLVLTTRGRKTGRLRQTPLAYLEYDSGWLVAGGAGGQRTVDWVANLTANPDATVELAGDTFAVVAQRLDGDAYTRAHDVALRASPRVKTYERRAGRQMPIFVLRPLGE